LSVAKKFRKLNKRIVFDAHEDLPKQLLSKPYLNRFFAFYLSKGIELYEKFICRKLDFIITATPSIRDKFSAINKNTVDINNFPLLNELFTESNWNIKKNEVCYIGGLSKIRGIGEIIKAIEITGQYQLNVAGEFSEENFKREIQNSKGWDQVNDFGLLDREVLKKVLAKSKAGLVTFLPFPNHTESQPNKMFEYMSAGLPVISSNFPLWKEIVEGNNCGICVNPEDPNEIAEAIHYLISNNEKAEIMGKNGRKAIVEKYNWEIEEKKLIQVYTQILVN
jgi:glycosyltransferase involved in cell wall biosynthesis